MDLGAVVDRLNDAAQRSDWETWQAQFSPSARFVLHPGDAMTVPEALEMTQDLASSGVTWSYANTERIVAENTLVEQHDTTLTLPDGAEITVEACVVYRFEGGVIVRFDEYIDIATLAPALDPE